MIKNNKALYEKIMCNIAKQVKRALNESEYKLDITDNDIEEALTKAKDGIYIMYYDHLYMDAWKVFIVRDFHIVRKDQYAIFDDGYSYGGPFKGARSKVYDLKQDNPDLPVYYCDIAWHTFPQEFRKCDQNTLDAYVKRFHADGVFKLSDCIKHESFDELYENLI